VICGAALAGAARRLQPAALVPLLDGVACAVRQAELLVGLALPKPPRRGAGFATPNGLSPALTRLFERR
jgi:allantoin racemase